MYAGVTRSGSATPMTDEMTGIVHTLSERKHAPRQEQEGGNTTMRSKHSPSSSTPHARSRTPSHSGSTSAAGAGVGMSPAEAELLHSIHLKSAALAKSKAELARSLAATKQMEKRINEEKQLLNQADWNYSQREGQPNENRNYWQPFHTAADAPIEYANIYPTHGSRTPVVAKGDSTLSQPTWRRSSSSAVQLSGTPRSHPAERTRTAAAANNSKERAGRSTKWGKDHPAGRSHRNSLHPNHPPSFAPEQPTEPVDVQSVIRAIPATKKTILDLFRSYDVHCTGAVNSNEFATGLIQAGMNLSMPQVAGLISKLDRDNRGEVRYINLIETGEDAFRSIANGELPDRLFDPPPAPQKPSVYVPIPPYETNDPVVDEARKLRTRQSNALAIHRTADRAMRNPDGSFSSATQQMPDYFTQLTSDFAPTSFNYFPRSIGFVERPYSASLGPSNIVNNPIIPPAMRASNSHSWGGDIDGPCDPKPIEGEFGKNYSSSVLDPTSAAGAGLRSISERTSHEPARFVAMMRKLDRDGDQKVSHKEFMRGLDTLGVNVPTWRIKTLIDAVDRHGTGTVAYEEVGGLLESYARAGRDERDSLDRARANGMPSSQPSPFVPGFKSSNAISLHTQPTWAPSNGIGNGVEEWTQARRVEKEWERKLDREQQEAHQRQQQQQDYADDSFPPRPTSFETFDSGLPSYSNAASSSPFDPESSIRAERHTSVPPSRDESEYRTQVQQEEEQQQSTHTQQQTTQQQQQQQPPSQPTIQQAHYPNLYRTSDEIFRLESRVKAAAAAAAPNASQELESMPPSDSHPDSTPYSQVGTELPVLAVEYPQLKRGALSGDRPGTAGPRRSRSRSSSISSVRSTRSIRSQTPSMRGGEGSRMASRRGSFSQAPRLGDHSTTKGGFGSDTPRSRLHDSDATRYWRDDRSDVGASDRGRSRTRDTDSAPGTPRHARAASASAAEPQSAQRSRVEVEQFGSAADSELFKILRLSIAPPLSDKARAARFSRAATPQPQQHDPSPDSFTVHHASDRHSSTPTPTRHAPHQRTRSDSCSSTASGSATDRSTGASYGLNYGAWSDRRARDFYGSGWTLG